MIKCELNDVLSNFSFGEVVFILLCMVSLSVDEGVVLLFQEHVIDLFILKRTSNFKSKNEQVSSKQRCEKDHE